MTSTSTVHFLVTTTEDIVDANDGQTSLREAILAANQLSGHNTIVFDDDVLADGGLIRLTQGELVLSSNISIDGDVDGDGRADVTITGDTAGDDLLLEGTDFTDTINNEKYSDNVRVFNITGGKANLASLNITGGYADDDGGGIYVADSATLELDQSMLIGNRANKGGGVSTQEGTITITNSAAVGNVATGYGGGLYIYGGNGTASLDNVTIAGNKAGKDGGGIFNQYDVTSLNHVTITGNYASDFLGGIGGSFDEANFTNSIVLGNYAGSGNNNLASNIGDDGNNIVGGYTTLENGDLVEADDIFAQVEDGAGVLADNGGYVQTVALKASRANIALDSVTSTLTEDARGEARPTDLEGVDNGGTADIGAYELADDEFIAEIVVTTADDTVDASDGVISLREAIALVADGGSVTFDADIFGDNGLIRLSADHGTLLLTTDITINGDVDGDGRADVTITGDANGDDLLIEGTDFTDGINNTNRNDNIQVLRITGDTANLTSLNITGGHAEYGGGIEVINQAMLNLDRSTVIGNYSAIIGGGIAAYGADINISNSTIAANRAQFEGGGVDLIYGTGTITNTTIVGNYAGVRGGGVNIYNYGDTTLVLDHVTVTGNFTDGIGGGIGTTLPDSDANLTLVNSIVLGNGARDGDDQVQSNIDVDNTNIIGANGETAEGVFAVTETSQFGDFEAGVLTDNGGYVQTVALKADLLNPAIDLVISSLNADARGERRPSDIPDVDNGGLADAGAYELTTTATIGPDIMYGTNDNDSLDALAGNDLVFGLAGDDTLIGGEGADTMVGGKGADVLDGSEGNDWVDYRDSSQGVTVDLEAGTGLRGDAEGDTLSHIENIYGTRHKDILTGDSGNNTLYGFESHDTLYGGAGADVLDAGAGNDVLYGGEGADVLDGGEGKDLADYRDSDAAVQIFLDGSITNTGGDAAGDTLIKIERVDGSNFADTLIGDLKSNKLQGLNGNDSLSGGAGGDTLIGGEGADVLDGGASNDTLIGGEGADLLDGGSNTDTAGYLESTAAVTVDLTAGTGLGGDAQGDTLSNIENINGSNFADILIGDQTSNKLRGFDGDDTLSGGAGNDILIGDHGADVLDGGTGNDFANYRESTMGVTVYLDGTAGSGGDAEGDTLINIEQVMGSSYADTLSGDGNKNSLFGFEGADTIDGGAGNDLLDGGKGADSLVGGGGADVLIGGEGADTLDGSDGGDLADYSGSSRAVRVDLEAGSSRGGDAARDTLISIEHLIGSKNNDVLTGNDENNTLTGQMGDDTINGGGGDDNINGGQGADSLDGGAGTDKVDYRSSLQGVTVDLEAGTGWGGDAQGDTLSNIENIQGSNKNDTLTGDVEDNTLTGRSGNDTIDGGGGNDTIKGDLGDDALHGGAGDDTLKGGEGADTLDGGTDTDWVDYRQSSAAVTVDLATGTGWGGDAEGDALSNIENFYASRHNDILIGDANDNTLFGVNGDDTLNGGEGADVLDGGAGNDWVDYRDSSQGVLVDLEAGTGLRGDAEGDMLSNIENIYGSDFDDILTGDVQDNVFDPGIGDAEIDGGEGYDVVILQGNSTDYGIVGPSGTSWDISKNGDNFVLTSIEEVRFDDIALVA